MAPGDLVTLDAVVGWLGATPSANAYPLLQRLIRAASAAVMRYCARSVPFAYSLVETIVDGNGLNFVVLRESPVIDIVSIDFGNGTIWTSANESTGSPPSQGYIVPDDTSAQDRLVLSQYCFPRGRSNIKISYHTGYLISGEAWVVPGSGPYTVATIFSWLDDQGVSYKGGAALTKVTGTPTVGEYAVVDGVYTFAAADANAQLLGNYSYCPEDVAQACIELVGERYKATTRIGEVSHQMQSGTTVSFSQKDMNDTIKMMLAAYRRTTPA